MNTVWESIYTHGFEEDELSFIQSDVEGIQNMILDRFNPFLQYLSARESQSQVIYEREVEQALNRILDGIMEDLEFAQFYKQVEIEKKNEERIFKCFKQSTFKQSTDKVRARIQEAEAARK